MQASAHVATRREIHFALDFSDHTVVDHRRTRGIPTH